jgi:hypothetical protein
MNTNDATRATVETMPERTDIIIGRAQDLIHRSDMLVELINMAAESGQLTGDAGNAIAWCCVHIRELLDKAGDILVTAQKQEGGAA